MLMDRLDWKPEWVKAPAISICTTRARLGTAPQRRMAAKLADVEIVDLSVGHAFPALHPEQLAEILRVSRTWLPGE
jgi:hypothetical protein